MNVIYEEGPFMKDGFFHDKTPLNRCMLPGVRPPYLSLNGDDLREMFGGQSI